MGGVMKLRWKYFLVLVAASLVPLFAVTWITQKASRRLGKTISERAQNTLTDTVRQEMTDPLGVSIDEIVAFETSFQATWTFEDHMVPVDCSITAIIDSLDIETEAPDDNR